MRKVVPSRFIRQVLLHASSVRCFGAIFLICAAPILNSAQIDFTRINGPEDQSIPIPQYVATNGRKDAGALQVILDYAQTVNAAAWSGMDASGTLTTADASGINDTSPATLEIQNGDQFRLDVDAMDSELSIRIDGDYGESKDSRGAIHTLPFATARLGLFAFPVLLACTYSNPQDAILDDGITSIVGRSLHRITLELPDPDTALPGSSSGISTVDLYFDPTTYLLVRSAAYVQLSSLDSSKYLIVTTYGDYRKEGSMLLPSAFTQTLNGQPQWTLQLSTIQASSSQPDSYFRF